MLACDDVKMGSRFALARRRRALPRGLIVRTDVLVSVV